MMSSIMVSACSLVHRSQPTFSLLAVWHAIQTNGITVSIANTDSDLVGCQLLA